MEQIVKRDVPPPITIDDPSKPVPQLNRIMADPTGEKLAAKIAGVEPTKDYDIVAKIATRVIVCREMKDRLWDGREDDGSPRWRMVSHGWFATFEGSFEALKMSNTDPGLKPGEEVFIMIAREKKL